MIITRIHKILIYLLVDVLGSILKNRVTQLRNHPQQEVDLVVLVDSSASVGAENFFNEVKFIRKVRGKLTSISTIQIYKYPI